MGTSKKAQVQKLDTPRLLEWVKSNTNKWVWATKQVDGTAEQHWLCWKHSRMYQVVNKVGMPRVVDIALFKLEHKEVEWTIPK